MTYYTDEQIKDIYRLRNKYWKTGDTDFLTLSMAEARELDEKFWDKILCIIDLAVRTHRPIQTVRDALALFGYECEG